MKKINSALWVATIIGVVILIITSFFPGVNGDEMFSINIVRGSFWQITVDTAKDVHPPLYYYLLKLGTFIEMNFLQEKNLIQISKLMSILPLIITIWFAVKRMKPYLGEFVTALFCFSIIYMPKMMHYGTEIRMYTWSLLFVSFAAWYAYKIMIENKRRDWICYCIWGLCACYTHYFAGLAVVVIHFLLFLYIIKQKRLKQWVISSVAYFLGYLPWLIILFRQIFDAGHLDKHASWIPPITFKQVLGFYSFMTTPSWNDSIDIVICGLTTGVLLLISIYFVKDYKMKVVLNTEVYMLGLIIVPFGVIAIGTTISLIMQPIFAARYLFAVHGLLWLGIAIGIERIMREKNKYINIFVYLFLVTMGTINLAEYIFFEIAGRV